MDSPPKRGIIKNLNMAVKIIAGVSGVLGRITSLIMIHEHLNKPKFHPKGVPPKEPPFHK